MVWLGTLALVAVLGLALWVRLAPSDPARWHTDPVAGVQGPNSATATLVLPLPPGAALAELDAVAMASPRTLRLAGSPAEGRITWVTRTRLMGYPDYTTAASVADAGGSRLVLHARARFGQSDHGVNAARLRAWTAALAARVGGGA